METTWFPQLKQTKTASPRLRILAFPNAGSAENVYTGMDKTSYGGGSGRRENTLIKWAKKTKVEIYAVQPPGREMRMKEPPLTTAKAIAKGVFEILPSNFFDVPFAVIGHSMGTWAAYEFLLLAPNQATCFVVSAFPGPYIADSEKPWTPQAQLPEKLEFQEECKKWNINEVIFTDGMWSMYEPLLRADFTCFDEYTPSAVDKMKLATPIRALYGSNDQRCTKGLVEQWSECTESFGMLGSIKGHHLFVYDEVARCDWFSKAISVFEQFQPAMKFLCVAPKGAALRAGSELTTKLLPTELENGNVVKVTEEQQNLKGTDRLHIVAVADDATSLFRPLDAWGSKKLFSFQGFEEKNREETKEEEAPMIRPPEPPKEMPDKGELYTVIGKAGAMLRAGCELDSADLQLTLEAGTKCYVVSTATNAKGSLRARIGRYDGDGVWQPIDGWCTAKFLNRVSSAAQKLPDGPVPLFDPPSTDEKGSHVFLFPGQGAQKVGMMTPYLETPGVQSMFELASKIFDGEDLLQIIQEGPEDKLNDTRYSQVCVFLTSLAAVKTLEFGDPETVRKANVCAGFSLGEYTALAFAGVLDLKTAVTLLKLRGQAMGRACDNSDVKTGMMTVVGLDDEQLNSIMTPNVSIANQLFPKGRVLSGPSEELAKVKEGVDALKVEKSKTIVQPVSGAFHSKYMQPAADELLAALNSASFSKPVRTVYSNVTARPHTDDIRHLMAKQLTAGVLWEDTIADLDNDGIEKFFEPAPGKQLTSMMRRINPKNQPKMNNV